MLIDVCYVEDQEHILDVLEYVESVLGRKHSRVRFPELKKFPGKNMSRSLKKGPYIDDNLLKKIQKQKESGTRVPIKTWARRSQVSPEFVGHKVAVHNGRSFVEILISEGMVGHRLGEFAPTRTFRGHGKVTKKVVTPT